MILSVVTLLIQLLPGILQGVGVISPAINKLITDLAEQIPGLIKAVTTGGSVPTEIITILQSFQAEITTLQADTNLDPAALQLAATLNTALATALAAYQAAGSTTDPSNLTPLPTDL